MATLTNTDYGAMRRDLYLAANAKAELKALPGLPNEVKFLAGLQALETRFHGSRNVLKNDLDAALGFVTTAALARKFLITYLRWKLRQLEAE